MVSVMQTFTTEIVDSILPDIRGTRLLVIGAGAVGRATLQLARPFGATLVIANRSPEKLEQIRQDIPEAETHLVDARNEQSMHDLLDRVKPDHIVLTTGYVRGFVSGSMDIAAAMDYIGDRLEPIMAIANWIARRETKPRSLSIVAGFHLLPMIGSFPWAILGPGMRGIAEHLAVELRPTRVNVLGPGPLLDTDMASRAAGSAEGLEEMKAALATQLPIGRPVLVEDCARQILFAAGDGVSTGSRRFVEGGLALVPSTLLGDLHKKNAH